VEAEVMDLEAEAMDLVMDLVMDLEAMDLVMEVMDLVMDLDLVMEATGMDTAVGTAGSLVPGSPPIGYLPFARSVSFSSPSFAQMTTIVPTVLVLC